MSCHRRAASNISFRNTDIHTLLRCGDATPANLVPERRERGLTADELAAAGFVHVDPLGWVHRSRKPPRELLDAFAAAHKDATVEMRRVWAATFFGDIFVEARKETLAEAFRRRLASLLEMLLLADLSAQLRRQRPRY
jgi:hypothetical protein